MRSGLRVSKHWEASWDAVLTALAQAARIGALSADETARRRRAIAVERDLVTERLAFLVGHTQEA
jgi:hypothetical protein